MAKRKIEEIISDNGMTTSISGESMGAGAQEIRHSSGMFDRFLRRTLPDDLLTVDNETSTAPTATERARGMAPAQKDTGGEASASKSLKQSGSFLVRVSVESGADGESEVRFFVRNLGDGREERLRDPEQLPERLLDQLTPLGPSEAPMRANIEVAQTNDSA